MEDLNQEGTPLLEISDSRVSLFRGVSVARNRAPVVVRQHRFDRSPPHSDATIEQHLHSVFAHAKARHPYSCTILEIHFKQSESEYLFSYVLEAPNAEESKASTPAEVYPFLLPSSQTLHPERVEDIAAIYSLQDEPFLKSAGAKFYRGQYNGARTIPVIVKKYKFSKLEKASTQKSISQCLTTALLQSQHPHCCTLLEVLMRFKKKQCTIFHVIESLPRSVGEEIEEKARQSESYPEPELWAFLQQISGALAYSHSRNIYHLNLHPASFYQSGEEFRVLDLGCHLMQGEISRNALNFISPQQRQHDMGLREGEQFNAMKADVFALGAAALWMATTKPPTVLVSLGDLDQRVAKVVAALPYSEQLKNLLRMIVAENEENRPTMQEIHSALPEALRVAARDNEELRQALSVTERGKEELRQALSVAARDNEELRQALSIAERGKEETLSVTERDSEELRQALSVAARDNEKLRQALSVAEGGKEELRHALQREQEKSADQELVISRLTEENLSLSEVVKCLTPQPTIVRQRDEEEVAVQQRDEEEVAVQQRDEEEVVVPQRDDEEVVGQQRDAEEVIVPQPDEKVVVQQHERSQLIPLVSFTRELLAELVNVDSIMPDFPSPFYPIVITGSQGKSSVLQSLLGSSVSYESKENDVDGLYMCPQPVLLGTIPVLLLKLRKETSDQSAYLELRRKVKAGVMSLSSVWCICEDSRPTSLEAMESLLQTYSEVKAKFDAQISKVFVFVRKDWFKRAADQRQLDKVLKEAGGLFEIRNRGAKGSEEDATYLADFARELANVDLHAPFLQSHQNAFSGNYRDRYISLLQVLTHVANLDADFATFLEKTPNLTDSDSVITSKLEELRKAADIAGLIKSSGGALDFIIQKEVTANSFQPVFHEEILTKLQQTYALNEPTIVLSVMGPPGCGKSTFLNYIVQYCTEATECRSIFKAGNTGSHTTLNSQVLSHPLSLGGKQLMLIDLEGLGGTETGEEAKSKAQINLVKAVMTISSVLIIIVGNEKGKLEKVKSDIAMLAQLNKDFGFVIKRVYLVFHDKQESAAPNSDFTRAVKEMNDTFFEKQEIVKLRNKPNFVAAGIDAARSSFLQVLLTDCAHFKAYGDGRYVNILDILTELAVIAQCNCENLEELSLNAAQCQKEVQKLCSSLQAMSDAVVSENNGSLLPEFERMMESSFRPWLMKQMESIPPIMHTRCHKRIQLEANKIKSELALCESSYKVIRTYSQEHMLKVIQMLVNYRHNAAWCVADFLYRVRDLGHLLENIKKHFPRGSETLTKLIECYESARNWKIGKSAINYTIGIVTSIATGGAAAAGVRAAQVGAAVAMSVVPRVLIAGATLGVGSILGQMAHGLCATAILIRKAEQLLHMKNSELEADMWKIITEMPTTHVPVLLFIGSKSACPTAFANAFLRNIAPFTPVEFNAFDPSEYAQILPFEYFHPKMPGRTVSRAYVICLRMKKKQTSKYAPSILKVAETLLPAASLTCIFSDRPDSYTESLLMKFRNIRPPSGAKIVVFSSYQRCRTGLNPLLRELQIPSKLKPIKDFAEEVITICAADIKKKFDKVDVNELRIILRQIALLPVSIRPRSILSDSAMKSQELIYVNSAWGNGRVTDAFWKMCSDNPSPYAPVVLVIGSKSTSSATFAFRFLQRLIPGASATFDPSRYTQVLCFDHNDATTSGIISRGYFVCLRMRKKSTSKYSKRMLKIAETLLPAASLTCILSDRLAAYFEPLLNVLSAPEARASYPEQKVIFWNTETAETLALLRSQAAAHLSLNQIQSFNEATILAMAQKAKQEFDTMKGRDPSFLLERVSALPTVFQD